MKLVEMPPEERAECLASCLSAADWSGQAWEQTQFAGSALRLPLELSAKQGNPRHDQATVYLGLDRQLPSEAAFFLFDHWELMPYWEGAGRVLYHWPI